MCECFSVIPVNQEESQRNNTLITKVKISEHIMIAENPTAIDYPRQFHTPKAFCAFQRLPGTETPQIPPGWAQREGWGFVCCDCRGFGDREGLSSHLGTCKS